MDRRLLYRLQADIWRTQLVICIKDTGETEICLIERGSNTYFMHSNANHFITVLKKNQDFVVVFQSLTVQIKLPLKL